MTMDLNSLQESERVLFSAFRADERDLSPVFILGAPRTGSTILYQVMAAHFGLPYIANITNDYFAETPIVGLAIQKAVPVILTWESCFGKTNGAFQPSEGSAVMTGWFGGGHPSQKVSARFLGASEIHFKSTLAAVGGLFGRQLLIKNAWNCFRVACLASAIPDARFVWIRRDISIAAMSDLEARYVTNGSAHAWNSATPANVETLKQLPPTGQVVENQFEFNKAIYEGLNRYAKGHFAEIWYEDFVAEPQHAINFIADTLAIEHVSQLLEFTPVSPKRRNISEEECDAIDQYLEMHIDRFAAFRHAGSS